jgi:hypothetical protein
MKLAFPLSDPGKHWKVFSKEIPLPSVSFSFYEFLRMRNKHSKFQYKYEKHQGQRFHSFLACFTAVP